MLYDEHGCFGCGLMGGRSIFLYLLKQGETQTRGPDGGLRVGALFCHSAHAILIDWLQPGLRNYLSKKDAPTNVIASDGAVHYKRIIQWL